MGDGIVEAISTDGAPAAVGPYSQAVRAGGLLFVSGQIPLDPAGGETVKGGLGEQAERALENLKRVVEAAGATLAQVAKVTLFITDMSRFGEVNEVYARYFKGDVLPARACVEVSALPKGVDVEVEAVVVYE